VNGKTIRDPETWVSLAQDRIRWEGREIRPREPVYLLFYKPTGVVTTYHDPQNRPTVYHYLTDVLEWVFPVGRLDKDSSGMLLLTNDTTFSEALTNPNSKIPKTYLVKVNFHPTTEELGQLESGIHLKNGETTMPSRVRCLRQSGKCSFLEMVIMEGKNRQIRRMIEALRGRVLKLVRTRIGDLSLGDLPIGSYRALKSAELARLRKPAGWGKIEKDGPRENHGKHR
jgi:pseudouridine synthase